MIRKLTATTLVLSILGPQVTVANPVRPVSVSYESLVRCFPELEDSKLSFKVDLNRLQELVDKNFVTSQSQLRQRRVHYVTLDGDAMNLILRTKYQGSKKLETELTLQKVSPKGIITDVAMTANQRLNPKQDTINTFLLNASIKSDEYTYNDTKLNGVTATFRRNFKDVQEYDLNDPLMSRSFSCNNEKDLGVICTCSKK